MKKVKIITTDRNGEDMTIVIDNVNVDDDAYSLFVDGGMLDDGESVKVLPSLGRAFDYARDLVLSLDEDLGQENLVLGQCQYCRAINRHEPSCPRLIIGQCEHCKGVNLHQPSCTEVKDARIS